MKIIKRMSNNMAKESKGKKQIVKKEGKKLGALYEISDGKAKSKNRTCPKCGPGMFLARHKDRLVCGSCKYVEFLSKTPIDKPNENKKE